MMLLRKVKKLEETYSLLALQINERLLFCGTKKQVKQFIMQSFGKIVDKKNFVKNLEKKIKKHLSLIEQVF